MHLYLIRHGQSYVNLPDWDQGFLDTPLTELGQQQAAALGHWLPSHLSQIDALYASTMRRARETASAVAQTYTCETHHDDRLREIGNNRLDHTAWSEKELPTQYANYWATARPFAPTTPFVEFSETYMHFRTRVGIFVEEMIDRHRSQIVLAVCHGGVIDAVFDHIFNVGPWRRCEMWTHNTGVSHFEYMEHPGREVWRLHYFNRVDHLTNVSVS